VEHYFWPGPGSGIEWWSRTCSLVAAKNAADNGTVNIWVALPRFHRGARQVNRRGALAQTWRAVERARAVGLSVGSNFFVTTAALAELNELAATIGAAADQRGDVLGNGRRLRGWTDPADA
jgi:hypothetical protein